MIRRPPRSTLDRSSAASDVYKRQDEAPDARTIRNAKKNGVDLSKPVSYTHLRAHETPEHLVCRLLLEKKKGPGDLPGGRVHPQLRRAAAPREDDRPGAN